jgi:hypothetical protein
MHKTRLLRATSGHPILRRWLWFFAAYLLVVYVLLLLGGQVGLPSPSDLGWSD